MDPVKKPLPGDSAADLSACVAWLMTKADGSVSVSLGVDKPSCAAHEVEALIMLVDAQNALYRAGMSHRLSSHVRPVAWLIDADTEHARVLAGSEWQRDRMGQTNELLVKLSDLRAALMA